MTMDARDKETTMTYRAQICTATSRIESYRIGAAKQERKSMVLSKCKDEKKKVNGLKGLDKMRRVLDGGGAAMRCAMRGDVM